MEAVILLAIDLPLTRGLVPAGTDVDADLGGLGVLDLATGLVARAGRSSATSASSRVLGEASWARQRGTLLFGDWYEANAEGLDTTSGGGCGGAGIAGRGKGGSGTAALAGALGGATTGAGGAGGTAEAAGGATGNLTEV